MFSNTFQSFQVRGNKVAEAMKQVPAGDEDRGKGTRTANTAAGLTA